MDESDPLHGASQRPLDGTTRQRQCRMAAGKAALMCWCGAQHPFTAESNLQYVSGYSSQMMSKKKIGETKTSNEELTLFAIPVVKSSPVR